MARKGTRQGSLFSSQEKKREQTETSVVISSLQQNAIALTALNQREKAHNEQLKAQVEQLMVELSKVKGTYWLSSRRDAQIRLLIPTCVNRVV